MVEATTGRCPMCGLVKPLRYSHLLPASFIPISLCLEAMRSVSGTASSILPIAILKLTCFAKIAKTSLSKGGETWVCPKLAWLNGSFPLYEGFISGAIVFGENEAEALLYAGGNPKINVQKLVHFALGIFWKAAVHSWRAPQDPMIDLGSQAEGIRLWLRGEAQFPNDISMRLMISPPHNIHLIIKQPVEVHLKKAWRCYKLSLLGTVFTLLTGDIPIEDRLFCFYRNSNHMALLSEGVARIAKKKDFDHYQECRKTDAYMRLKTNPRSRIARATASPSRLRVIVRADI